jgi:hypothetical protein
MADVCRRCKKHDFGICKTTNLHIYDISNQKIKNENYQCFDERVYKSNSACKCDSECVNVYLDEIDYSDTNLHMSMKKSEKGLRKTNGTDMQAL